MALGKPDKAAKALNRAHMMNTIDPAFLVVRKKPKFAQSSQWANAQRNYCKVDFQCFNNCPGGITGRIMAVTCKMNESSAQLDCEAGKPYPTSYRCEEEIPEYGILIPGLSSGLSIVTPFGRVDFTINGAGKVNYRIKGGPNLPGGLSAELEAKGSYTQNEGIKVQRITPKISLNIPVGKEAGKLLDELNMGPATLSVTDEEGGTIKIESYDSTLWAN